MPQVVTCLLEQNGKILLLKRSTRVGTYKGQWGGIAGYVEELEAPYDTAIKEISQEAGLDVEVLTLIKKGNPIELSDTYEGKRYDWVVYPFLFQIQDKALVHTDWEHEEYRWIHPSEIKKFDTVPGLDKVVQELLGTTDML
jgi:8-oxo-dGTP pyrophosphatase MutT (NUDIX family)